MAEHKMLIPGAETPEGQARIQREVEARSDIDFRAFQKLAELREGGVLHVEALVRIYREDWMEGDDWAPEGHAREVIDEIDQIIRNRRMADHYVLQALAGRPDPREEG